MGSILTLLFGRPKLAPPKPEGSADPAASGTAAGASAAAADASALRENIQKKGENAYYYAHNRKFEVPADAKVISGPGLVTGGPPVKLDIEANAPSADKPLEAIRNFSWTDDGGKVKVYLQLPDGTLQDASQVTCDFQPHSFHVQVSQDKGARYMCKMDPLYGEVVPESCSFRSSLEKSKVTVTLTKKKKDQTWYDLKKN
ncbi:unnamed protein product [Effrenium voratum]|uniref:CS domain-containing protein n=1 Tax=Effrenium voratum TaxID=2562239 RepID=A0AA36J749_9DINO|nr:unnamed protein product [Effrenium voratum]